MLVLSRFFVKNNPAPMIIKKHPDVIEYINRSAKFFLEKNGCPDIKKITEINRGLAGLTPLGDAPVETQITLKKIKFKVTAYSVTYDGIKDCILLQINDHFTTADYEEILDHIGDSVSIFNRHTQMVRTNAAARALSDNDETYIGETAQWLVDKGLVKKAACLEVFKTRTAKSMNVTYFNGHTLMYSSKPIFDRHGDLKRVISIGRDITKIINLEKRLAKTEKKKNEYLIRLKELGSVYDRELPVFASREMEKLIQTCDKISDVDSSVFLNGETGVGKEVIAQYIHKKSLRKTNPFIPVNCGTIPENLFETELFGYEEGAFTGSRKGGKAGLFETADGGTIFLDEISEMPQNMQSKLLRVIQEKKFNRIGSNKSISIDVRFICASNLPQDQLKENAVFRQDLYYRLATIPIDIPPLRERLMDIPPLTEYFLSIYNKKYMRKTTFHKDLIESLLQYTWPGNIRELKNLIERVVILSDEDIITQEEFRTLSKFPAISDEKEEAALSKMPLSKAIKKLENNLITRACHNYKSIYKAAEALEVAPSTIYRKINKGEIVLDS